MCVHNPDHEDTGLTLDLTKTLLCLNLMEEECMPGDQLQILTSAFGQLVWLENPPSVHVLMVGETLGVNPRKARQLCPGTFRPQWDEPNTTKPNPHRCHVISWIDVLIIIHNPASRGRICPVMSSTWQEKSVDVELFYVLCGKKAHWIVLNYVNSCNVLMNLTYITVFNTHLNPNQVVLLPKPH